MLLNTITPVFLLFVGLSSFSGLRSNIAAYSTADSVANLQASVTVSYDDRKWQKLAKLPARLDGVKVLDGRELLIAGIRCRLFGIRLHDDLNHRQLSKRFLELYVLSNGGYFFIHNIESPVKDKDGIPLVWLANPGNGAWAQEALVQYGLAIVDYRGFEDYKFRAPRRSYASEIDWKSCLENAQRSWKEKIDPNIDFNWPERKPDLKWKKLGKLENPLRGIKVLNGREILIGGIRCRLFGIRLLDNELSQDKAKRFLELYIRDYGGYFFIYNHEAPVNDYDGVPLIWLQGSGNGGWAQETLVEAGLATVEYRGFDDYKFRVPGKEIPFPIYDWKECLRKAEANHAAGNRPNINFRWPQ